MSLNTPYGILSFPNLFQPKPRSTDPKAEPVYSAVLIFSPVQQQDKAYKALVDACIQTAKDEWGDKVDLKSVKMPFRDAGEKEGSWSGFEAGHTFISPWTKTKPGIVNSQRQDVLLPEEVWGGQTVRMNLNPYPWVNSGRKGVSFALNHVQIVRTDTPRLDGRGSPSAVFDDGKVTEEEIPF